MLPRGQQGHDGARRSENTMHGMAFESMAVFGMVVLAVFVLVLLVAAIRLIPDFVRYMKMKAM
jgi:hypothetical protein